MSERIVVVGGGLGGVRSAERLREMGFDGQITILSAERHLPYHRPCLSKQIITGEWHPDDSLLSFSGDLDAEWRLNSPALHLDPKTQSVWVPGGEEIKYDGMIIATGVDARAMGGAPRHDPRVHVLRTLDDAVAIRKNIRQSQGLVAVIGGGFIGCELACSVRHMGRDVALIVRSPALLGGVVGDAIGKKITEAHVEHGVRLATGVGIKHWVRQPGGIGIHLSDGQVFFASCVVLAVGASPAVDWLRGSGLVIEDGVLCDATNHVVGAENIVACGDVARWPNMRFNGAVRRVEHWLNAVEGGRAAAENLLVGRTHAKPYTPVPRFWTEQYGMRVQGAGLPVLGTDTTDVNGLTGFIADGKLVGIVGLESPGKIITETPELFRQNTVQLTQTVWTQPAEETKVAATPEVLPTTQIPVPEPVAARASSNPPSVSSSMSPPLQRRRHSRSRPEMVRVGGGRARP